MQVEIETLKHGECADNGANIHQLPAISHPPHHGRPHQVKLLLDAKAPKVSNTSHLNYVATANNRDRHGAVSRVISKRRNQVAAVEKVSEQIAVIVQVQQWRKNEQREEKSIEHRENAKRSPNVEVPEVVWTMKRIVKYPGD